MTYEVAARSRALAIKRQTQANQQSDAKSDAKSPERGKAVTPTIREVLENARRRYLEDLAEAESTIQNLEGRIGLVKELRRQTDKALAEIDAELERHPAYDTQTSTDYQLSFASFV